MTATTTTRNPIAAVALLLSLIGLPCSLLASLQLVEPSNDADCFTLIGPAANTTLLVDSNDWPVVQLAARFFADDLQRVAGRHPQIIHTPTGSQVVVVGTLGHSGVIDQLAAAGKLTGLEKLKGRWETTLIQLVQQPYPGINRALIIAGSDRRGTAYGLMQLSEILGVSPWYWWADVPSPHRNTVAFRLSAPQLDAPGVKYRGIFINDEDWGLNPWASKTFDPDFKNIGPKTYEKVFELMLRLRLNYIWPAMHGCSTEFGSAPENVALADKFAIVAGSSHCEPMLCNNVHWKEQTQGRWNYSLNRDAIHSYWKDNVEARGSKEAVWTLGIRGIHDAAMERPPSDLPGRINLVDQVIKDQRALLNQYVTTQWGPVAQCFVPYKEVLPIYDAGLKVPGEVTLVWVDDNFGYIRRLSSPGERTRPGGAGVYWHISYYGGPHSYTWLNTTAPALIWEELHKAWENDARNLWVINVGDIKPMEIGIDYFARLAWSPDVFALGAQRQFLHDFAEKNFGVKPAQQITGLLMEYYRLGTVRKPELMNRAWACSLPQERSVQLESDYHNLLQSESSLAAVIPAQHRDAYTELIGFPARVLGSAGLIFMADRKIQQGAEAEANQKKIDQLRGELEAQVGNFNTNLAGGKWNRIMPGLVTGRNLTQWNSQVRWPWGETRPANVVPKGEPPPGQSWRDAATTERQLSHGPARWDVVEGLGPSGHAMALLPESLDAAFKEDDTNAPALEWNFSAKGGDAEAFVDFLPTFRIYPGMKSRVAVSVDHQPAALIEVPGSSGDETENGAIRSAAVQNNYTRARIPLPALTAGQHTFTIRAIDPGAIIDRLSLP